MGVAEVRSECKILIGNLKGDLAIDIGMILTLWRLNYYYYYFFILAHLYIKCE